MPFSGIVWAMIICIPFWLFVILLVKTGLINLSTLIISVLALLGLLFILFLRYTHHTNIKFPCYEVRNIGDLEWHEISEIKTMKILVEYFYPVTPVLSRLLKGEEIIASDQIYRLNSH